jgi:hypothetical protein
MDGFFHKMKYLIHLLEFEKYMKFIFIINIVFL